MAPTPEEYAAAAFDHDEIALIYSGLVNQFLAKLREYEEHDDTLKFLSETIQIATLMFLEIFNIVCLETNTYSIEGYIADNYSEIYEN